jgi:hypothetical protein
VCEHLLGIGKLSGSDEVGNAGWETKHVRKHAGGCRRFKTKEMKGVE